MALMNQIAFERFRKVYGELTETQKRACARRFWYMVVAPMGYRK